MCESFKWFLVLCSAIKTQMRFVKSIYYFDQFLNIVLFSCRCYYCKNMYKIFMLIIMKEIFIYLLNVDHKINITIIITFPRL